MRVIVFIRINDFETFECVCKIGVCLQILRELVCDENTAMVNTMVTNVLKNVNNLHKRMINKHL